MSARAPASPGAPGRTVGPGIATRGATGWIDGRGVPFPPGATLAALGKGGQYRHGAMLYTITDVQTLLDRKGRPFLVVRAQGVKA